jgi:hypothetical protein
MANGTAEALVLSGAETEKAADMAAESKKFRGLT